MQIILAHENADFDAVAALLAAHRLNPQAIPVLPEQRNRNVEAFLALYRSALPFVRRKDVDMQQVAQITLVDTQRLPQIKRLPKSAPVLVIDHHPVKDAPEARYTLTGEVIGSTTTLLVEQIQAQQVAIEPLEATLMALGIYEDTGSLTYGGTTPRDIRAAAWLVENHAALDTVRRFLEPPLTDEQHRLFEKLLASAETRTIEGYAVTVAAARFDTYVEEVAAIAHRLREILDPAALFVLTEMPSALHLVCRSTTDAIDAGAIAQHFGGGGHERAAAASLHDTTFDEALAALWRILETSVQPRVRVVDLMSYGIHTVDADKPLKDVAGKLRRIGHEGYPVVENGVVVGLLTRRDADRAIEHGLGSMTVREVMTAGKITLRPSDSVGLLEETMVESGWGQIPVMDGGKLTGIVTRTDLIKHWASTHPTRERPPEQETLSLKDIEAALGGPVATLIGAIAQTAQSQNLSLYLVGGVVRDLLLKRPNLDVDFVVEGDAPQLAAALQQAFGGVVHSFRPFGTAKWTLDGDVARKLRLPPESLPDHVDFATARNEFYEHPTALPTVYSSSIKLDLGRRDFTINTLAMQFSPAGAQGRVLDFYGGLRDLRQGLIRVLHNLSFVDDPTRILRAVRFETRLGFQIEARSADLMQTALPMLRRITGERVRNELTLLLGEIDPARGLLALQARGILTAIHPALAVAPDLGVKFERARVAALPLAKPDITDLYWLIIGAGIPLDALGGLLERLLFPQTLADALLAAARLMQDGDWLRHPDTRPSQIDARLKTVPEPALYAAWLLSDDPLTRERLERYVTGWRQTRIATDGQRLKTLGLKPGPCYTPLLARLRAARLDGEISTNEDESALLQRLLDEGVCDDSA